MEGTLGANYLGGVQIKQFPSSQQALSDAK